MAKQGVQGVGVGRWEDVGEGLGGGRENNRGRTGIAINMANVIIIQQIIYGLQLHTQTGDKEMTK